MKSQLKVLLIEWNSYCNEDMKSALREQGHLVQCISFPNGIRTSQKEAEDILTGELTKGSWDFVFSFNYFPVISEICRKEEVKYLSWVYDSPYIHVYSYTILNDCNYVFLFDYAVYEELRQAGIKTVYYLPLAVNAKRLTKSVERLKKEFKAGDAEALMDISFVGSLYTGEHDYYDMLFPEEAWDCPHRGLIEDTLGRQCFSYREDHIKQALAGGQIDLSVVQEAMERQGLMLGEDYFAKPEDILVAAVLEKKVTVEERRTLLAKMAEYVDGAMDIRENGTKRKHDFRLYTGSDTKDMPVLDRYNCGMVDYHRQMPLVFAGSRINLNITLRSIHSGIPLRVLDIMACGGFVLTNWQPEIAEHFRDGVEIALYSSLEECMDKVSYYLSHEEERRRIAHAGQRKVEETFSYQAGLLKLFG